MTLGEVVFSVQRWRPEFGDPAAPTVVLGVTVKECLARRGDDSAALVSLADRRFAVTGAMLAVGSARQLGRYLRQRAGRSTSVSDRDWLTTAADTLARRLPERSRRRAGA